MYREILDSVSNGNIKGPVENLPLKLFRATLANADIESLKSLHTSFDTYLDSMLVKFKPNRIVQNVQTLELSHKKSRFLKSFSTKPLTPF